MIPNRDPQGLSAFSSAEENLIAVPHPPVFTNLVVSHGTSVVPTVADEWIIASGRPPITFEKSEQQRKIRESRRDQSLIPSEEEAASLTRWGRMAFAVRCARRVLPLIGKGNGTFDPVIRTAFLDVVETAERAAATADLEKPQIAAEVQTIAAFPADSIRFGRELVAVALAAAHAEGRRAAEAVVTVLQQLATVETLALALMPRRDFNRLRRLTLKNEWTDETPISPNVFGPMWLRAKPEWWQELAKNP